MGGFIGGIVSRGTDLPQSDLQNVISTIGRRGGGIPFVKVRDLHTSSRAEDRQATIYLASAQEPGFSQDGTFPSESPLDTNVMLIDGYPMDRTISELRDLTANQRTVIHDFDADLLRRISSDRGPFAFASIDFESNYLFLGRDLLGRKAIYFYESDLEFWFSTDLPALLQLKAIPRKPNPSAVYDYLRHGMWNTTDQTMFSDIRQVPPGTILKIHAGLCLTPTVVETREFTIPEIEPIGFSDAVTATRSAFLESIERCIPMNQNPIGASLSGGTDSSSIVAAMRDVVGPEREIHSFSFITPEHERINEEYWIDIASQAAGTISHKIEVTSDEYAQSLSDVTSELGEPLLGISQYLQYRVGFEAKAAGVRNILDGISGDPITGGHEYQVFDRLRKSVSQKDIRTTAQLSATILRHVRNHPSRAYIVQALAQLPPPLHRFIRSLVRLEVMPSWMDAEWFGEFGIKGTLPAAAKGTHPFQEHVISTITESRTIRVAERNAAVNSANSRMPFLDASFVEHMLGMPEHFSFGNDGTHRVAFAAAMNPYVPAEILERTNKVGFNAPDNHWLAEQRDWGDELLARAKELGVPINIDHIPKNISSQKVNRYDVVRCLSLIVWADRYQIHFD